MGRTKALVAILVARAKAYAADEPLRVRAFAASVLATLVSAGFDLPAETILIVVTALLVVASRSRRKVTPTVRAESARSLAFSKGVLAAQRKL